VTRRRVPGGPVIFLAVLAIAVAVAVLMARCAAEAVGAGRAPTSIPRDATPVSQRWSGRVERTAGWASSFGPGLWHNQLACGGRLYRTTHAVAHRWLPCGTWLRVCYRRRCQDLLVRDRGPFVAGRSLDLTEAAVRRFGFRSAMSWGVRLVTYWRRYP
jgi:rare lipoprotein A (peptidoglycan hydrolase)